jgi:hypothetical protein
MNKSTPCKVLVDSVEDLLMPSADPKYRTAIAVVPDAAIFYSCHDRSRKHHPQMVVHPVPVVAVVEGDSPSPVCGLEERPYIPLCISWLRLLCHHNGAGKSHGGIVALDPQPWFAAGGYVKHLCESGQVMCDNRALQAWKKTLSGCSYCRITTNCNNAHSVKSLPGT